MRRCRLVLLLLAFARCGAGGAVGGADLAGVDATPESALSEILPDAPGDAPIADERSPEAVEPPCGSCHGSADQPAPPPGLDGATLPSAPGVGAHAAHLAASTWHAEVRCRHCHVVPTSVDAPGHLDDARPADVTLAGLAATGVAAAYGPDGCTTYCHGSALHVDPRPSPPWTGAQDGCTACHASPPPFPHPSGADCGRCHLDVADATGAIAKAALHLDGALQAPHGAHLFHLGGGAGTILACDHCHVGTAYHGSLRDGQGLEGTTLCDECHPDGFARLKWRVDPWERMGLDGEVPEG